MISVDPEVYVISCLSKDGGPHKRQRLADVSVVFDFLDPVPSFDPKVPWFANLPFNDEPPAAQYDSSRRSTTVVVEEQELKSTISLNEVIQ
jgi:hypothetical protein